MSSEACFLSNYLDLTDGRTFSEVVEIHARKAKPLVVHKAILVKEPFFEKCLQHGFQEGLYSVIRMPDDDTETVEDLVGYLYFGKSALEKYDITYDRKVAEEKEKAVKAKVKLMKLCHLAEKIGSEELHNTLMDRMFDWPKQRINPKNLTAHRQMAPMECPLQRYRLTEFAWYLKDRGLRGWGKERDVNDESVLDWFAEGGELVREVVKLMTSGETLQHPNQMGKCHWHIHQKTSKCTGAA